MAQREALLSLLRECRQVAQDLNQKSVELHLALNACIYSLERGIDPGEAEEEPR